MSALLLILNIRRADPFVEVGVSERGGHLLGEAVEVHLETVVKDLKERFARVDFQVCAAKRSRVQGWQKDGAAGQGRGSC